MEALFGKILALICAITWAVAVIFFKKSTLFVSPIILNFYKTTIGTILFIITDLFFIKQFFTPLPVKEVLTLVLSGLLGISISDTLYFKSLDILGASLNSIVACSYTPAVILLSMVFLGERLTLIEIIGTLLVLASIVVATIDRNSIKIERKRVFGGVFLGITSMVLVAFSIIIINESIKMRDPLLINTTRMLSGSLGLFLLILFTPHRKGLKLSLKVKSFNFKYMLPGSILGGYLSLILWIGAFKLTTISSATVLNQTSTIFVLLLSKVILKEEITPLKSLAVISGFIGTSLMFL